MYSLSPHLHQFQQPGATPLWVPPSPPTSFQNGVKETVSPDGYLFQKSMKIISTFYVSWLFSKLKLILPLIENVLLALTNFPNFEKAY
jgi:hypothetical protein